MVLIIRYFMRIVVVVLFFVILGQLAYSAYKHYSSFGVFEWPWSYGYIPAFELQIFLGIVLAIMNSMTMCLRFLKTNAISLKTFFLYVFLIVALYIFSFVFFRMLLQPIYEGLLLRTGKGSDLMLEYIFSMDNLYRALDKPMLFLCGVVAPALLVLQLLTNASVVMNAFKSS